LQVAWEIRFIWNCPSSKVCSDSYARALRFIFMVITRASPANLMWLVYSSRGTPQIEVTFEVDANGILNVKAEDKASGKSEKITITNDKGRLSQEEIERMVREAEEFAEDDKKVKEKIDARNSLETYVYNMKNQVNDKDKLADKLEADEKEKIETAVKEALEWLDDNQSAEKEDYEEKLKEVEAVCNPIITSVYQRSGGAPGGAADGGDDDDSNDEL